ncbi:MAG: PAS domain-containing protein, partial [Tissierellales bacterium]|nr:PAS domain-containing protein [Tissierellales bacterium]
MFKDIISTRKENKKNMMIMLFVGLIIILLSFFINVVFIGLIGLIFIIPSSIISGTSGAVLSTAISTIAVMIATYTNFAELHIVNIVVSLMVYWFIGLMIGRNIDKEKAQTKKIEEMNKELIDTKEEIQKVFEGTQDNMFLIEVIDDETFRFVRNNNAHQKSTGLTVEMIKGKTPIELLGDELGSKIQDNYKKCIEMMTTVTYEEELALPAGTKIWHTSLSPI